MKLPSLITFSLLILSLYAFSIQQNEFKFLNDGPQVPAHNPTETNSIASSAESTQKQPLFKFKEMAPVLLPASLMSKSSNELPDRSTAGKSFLTNQVIAHRGAFKNTGTPENSAASLKAAIAIGCAGSETDLHMTKDGILVINHDSDIQGIPIQTNDYAALKKVRLSNGESIPTLENFLKIIQAQGSTRLILEIKPSVRGPEWAKKTVQKVIKTIHQMKAQDWLVYISFDYEICKEVLRLEPTANVQYLEGNKTPLQLKADGIRGADYNYSHFKKNPEWIQSAKENKIDLNAWTVNNARDMQWLLANDFEYITTNEPELLFEEIKRAPVTNGWTLKWSDEFNYSGLPDDSKWNYDEGGHGWGNDEKQFYTRSDTNNAIVKEGVLSIITRKENKEKNNYTSARLLTKEKATWTYGRIEVSAKLPKGVGLWPAIWMLGADIDQAGWPACGEIDIMEHVGYRPEIVFGTVHTEAFNHLKNTQKGAETTIKDPYNSFNTYAIEWDADKIVFFLNDTEYFRFNKELNINEEWPFDKPFFLVLNTAVGGNFGGKKGIDDSVFPAVYDIDYVRVFQKK